MVLERIYQAYQAENVIGSYFTAPLRAYNDWFTEKLRSSFSFWEHLAWRVAYFISGIFASMTLGVVALIGIALNCCLMPCKKGYSLWAHFIKVPHATDQFLKDLETRMKGFPYCVSCYNMISKTSSDRAYSYNKEQKFTFKLENLFVSATSSEMKLKAVELHFQTIQDKIRGLSQSYNWFPEIAFCKKEINSLDAYVIILIPDQCKWYSSV